MKTVVYACDKYADTAATLASKRMFRAAGVELVEYLHTGREITLEV